LNQSPALDLNALLNGLPNRTLTGGLPNQLQYRAASELPMSSRDSTSGMGLNGIATLVWPNLSRHLIGNLSVLMRMPVSDLPKNPLNELFEIRFFYLDADNK